MARLKFKVTVHYDPLMLIHKVVVKGGVRIVDDFSVIHNIFRLQS